MIAKEVMRNIEGVGIFPMISLVLFFLLFTATVIYAFTMKRDRADIMSALPLENETENETDTIS